MHPWRRYVAIGDSFTEGLCDLALPGGGPSGVGVYLGWADRLAARLAADLATELGDPSDDARDDGPAQTMLYANLAVRGRLLGDIVGPQLDAALALLPDLVSVVGGGNDILRPRADVDALAQSLDDAVARIRATGADALMVTPVDPKDAPVIRSTRGRVATFVAHQNVIARRHGAFLVDQWSLAVLRDWRLWAEDRIHLTPDGHRRVAAAAALTLGLTVEDGWSTPLPPRPAPDRRQALREDARWAREYLGPWVRRRLRGRSSGDAVVAKRPALQPVSVGRPA
jgi:lysophospholipase L1-like esterase